MNTRRIKLLFLSLSLAMMFSCGTDEDDNPQPSGPNNANDWLVPSAQIFDGGPGKDGIPSIDNPQFTEVDKVDYLDDDELVIGILHDGQAKAYPHQILDWHEIVNDEIDDIVYGLTYCPLTGTGIAWDRNIDGQITTFGVSGKLYNTNLIPYDRATDSYWSQMRLDCINGSLIGEQISTYDIIETSWKTWKKSFPSSMVLNRDTGFERNYNQYPYGDYRTNNARLIFPVSVTDSRLPGKERVLGLVSGEYKKVYSIELFKEGRTIEDVVNGKDILVVGSKIDNYVLAFQNQGFENMTFVADQLPVIAEDDDGNRLSLSGQIVEGSRAGLRLETEDAFMGFFFAFGTFYTSIEIYRD